MAEGMVSVRDEVGGELERMDRLEILQIHALWKTAVASKQVLADEIGPRLENLFWRILQSEKVIRRTTGSELARQVKGITDGDYIRTTPTGSPRASRGLETYYPGMLGGPGPSITAAQSTTAPAPLPGLAAPEYSEDEGTPTPKSTSPFARRPIADVKSAPERKSNLGRLPPILKKSGASSGPVSAQGSSLPSPTDLDHPIVMMPGQGLGKDPFTADVAMSRQLSAEGSGSQLPRRYTATRFSEEVKVSIPKAPGSLSRSTGEKSPRSRYGSYSKTNKRNPIVKASVGSSKKRPIVMRQRSSVASQEGSLGSPSPVIRDPTTGPGADAPTKPGGISTKQAAAKGTRRSRASSPHPTGQSSGAVEQKPPSDSDQGSSSDENNENPDPESPPELPIERPKRSANITTRASASHRSFTNLPSAAWRSSAAAPAAASYQASGLLSPRQDLPPVVRTKTAFREDVVPLKAPGPSSTTTTSTGTPSAIPRTRSQLALLLERNPTSSEDKKKAKAPDGR